MRLNTAPLLWDLDAQGNVAPQVTPAAGVTPLTFNLSGLDGRTEDLWNYIQAIWIKVAYSATQATSAGAAVDHADTFNVVDSFNVFSPVLGDVLAQKSNQGPVVGLVDQVFGAGWHQPVPYSPGVAAPAATTLHSVYYRIPLALDCYGRPQDTGVWAPLFEKGRVTVNVAPSGTVLGGGDAVLAAVAATITAAFEILPFGTAQIHSPSKFVRYEFNTAGVQLKILSFGNGDGFLGVNPGARLAMLLWLSNNNHLGGLTTIDNWARISLPWRHQRVVNNPDFMMAAFNATGRARVVGNATLTAAVDSEGWPYTQAAPIGTSVLSSSGLFFPIVWPGRDANLSAGQKQVGDLQIDAGWTGANPNGTHVFRTLEHYSWQPSMISKIMGLMGFDTATYTAEPKTGDNTDPRMISSGQLWGLPLRIVDRKVARRPVV
jgi:hypothetical protein